jgi:hypothetical protein
VSLLENIQRVGGGLLDFANGLPGVLAPSMNDPSGDPQLSGAADPASVTAARERYRRAYVAQMMQAAQSGTPLAALDATAATAAQPSYDTDIGRAVQTAQALKTQREQAKRTEALQTLISSVTDPKQRAALSVATPDQAAEAMLKDAYAKPLNAGERYSMTALGNGLALVLDKQSGQTHIVRDPSAAAGGAATAVDPETINRVAVEAMFDPRALTQHFPGKWNASNRALVEQQQTENMKAAGLRPSDLPAIRANATAQFASAKQMQGQLNAIEAFEKTARFNGERLLDLVGKIDDTSVPIVEGYARAFARKGGSVDAAEFANVLTHFQSESARILNTVDGKGIVTDSARHELTETLPKDMTAAQAKRIINRIFLEMDARKGFLSSGIGSAYGSAANGFNGAPAWAPPPANAPGAASVPGGLDTVPKPYAFPTLPRQ